VQQAAVQACNLLARDGGIDWSGLQLIAAYLGVLDQTEALIDAIRVIRLHSPPADPADRP